MKGVGRVERPYRRVGRDWEALPKIQERSGELGEVGSLSWRAGRGQKFLPECRVSLPKCREGSGGLPAGPGGVGRPSQMARRSREALSDGWEGWKVLP